MTTETIVAALGGFAAVLTAVVRFVKPARALWVQFTAQSRKVDDEIETAEELKKSLREIRRVAAIKAVLQEWVKQKGAQRALLFVASNGGEAWKGVGPLFCSNPAQAVGPGEPNTIDLWQGWRVDAWYREFLGSLLQIHDRRRGLLLINGADVEGELSRQYRTQGTHASIVLPFKWSSGGVLWYVSINFGAKLLKDENGKETEATVDQVNRAVMNAREIYEDPTRCRLLIQELRRAFDSAG